MSVFAVLPDSLGLTALKDRIDAKIPPGDALQLPGGAWLVSFEGTSRALSDLIGITEGEPSGGVIVSVSSYWGRASKDVWEWLQNKSK